MSDLSRRGLLGLLTSAATAIRAPGEVIAKAALSTAGVVSAGVGGAVAGPSTGPGKWGTPQWWARKTLSAKVYGFSPLMSEIVPEVACFRSASLTSKHRWTSEVVARRQQERELAELALQLLESGEVVG